MTRGSCRWVGLQNERSKAQGPCNYVVSNTLQLQIELNQYQLRCATAQLCHIGFAICSRRVHSP